MALNNQSSKCLLHVFRSSKQTPTLLRHAHTFSRPSSLKPQVATTSSSLSSYPYASMLFSMNDGLPSRKRRRYFSTAGLDASDDGPVEETGARRGQQSHDEGVGASGRKWKRPSKRPKDPVEMGDDVLSSKEAAGTGSAAAADTGGSKRKGKKRLELRDLAEPKKQRSEPWQTQKDALQKKFGDAGWNPRKKLSPDTMEGIRALHAEDPERYSTPQLAEHFKVSPEAVRRILKSKWRATEKEMEKRRERWAKRHDRIWDQQSELGLRPKRKTDKAEEEPDEFEENLKAKEMLDNARSA
ncbi:Required for respiratory growth protein 9 mitochondrial [Exophiala xenobiotica]|nr:Required for respiratory growth protein 9 mitochondrial [Exophiala xenobiotica]KAK5270728.1 Required for respiratory growth protein 9 mitochondrial [Exophiala xenobiotica]KAK5339619.1 Required for respiratory growth protein 9 mitochondrial [Exophiala xenobiotica]